MSKLIAGHLLAGFIFGDPVAGEYVYLPGGEIGLDHPLCVFESPRGQIDLPLDDAAALVMRLSLKQVTHPWLGTRI